MYKTNRLKIPITRNLLVRMAVRDSVDRRLEVVAIILGDLASMEAVAVDLSAFAISDTDLFKATLFCRWNDGEAVGNTKTGLGGPTPQALDTPLGDVFTGGRELDDALVAVAVRDKDFTLEIRKY